MTHISTTNARTKSPEALSAPGPFARSKCERRTNLGRQNPVSLSVHSPIRVHTRSTPMRPLHHGTTPPCDHFTHWYVAPLTREMCPLLKCPHLAHVQKRSSCHSFLHCYNPTPRTHAFMDSFSEPTSYAQAHHAPARCFGLRSAAPLRTVAPHAHLLATHCHPSQSHTTLPSTHPTSARRTLLAPPSVRALLASPPPACPMFPQDI